MELQSINISLVKEKMYNDKMVKTGILKESINHSVHIFSDHVEGDQQADLKNHGGEYKAVYGYSFHHYAYWKKLINQDDIQFGYFGENLTFDNLIEEDLHIGDQLHIGEAILSISQPRSPCYKLNIASNNKIDPKLFIQYGKTGIYFKVLKEGQVNVDSKITIQPYAKLKLSVFDLFQATFGPKNEKNKDILQIAFDHPELAPAWKNSIKNKM
ncbi:MAG: molybdenum cofactor biosysynthesis protein [Planctomycetota bacterium]|nr:MAG: molybdenum cofactor biosysynthesis protein [Planctomycetota bacterium]